MNTTLHIHLAMYPKLTFFHQFAGCLIALCAGAATARASECQINACYLDAQGRVVLRHTSAPAFYYTLHHGAEVTAIVSPVDMALGLAAEGRLAHDPPAAATSFYRVRQTPVTAPADTDGDGIDDVWELRSRRPRAALDPADAQEDHDGSGLPDLQDYRDSRFLTAWIPSSGSSALSYGGEVNVQVRFSQVVNGQFTYHISGDAVAGEDYQALDGLLSVNSSKSAIIPVRLLTPNTLRGPRSIVLTLQTPPDNVGFRIPAAPSGANEVLSRYSSHVITIRDADKGLYSGNLSFLSQTTVTVENGETNVTILPAPAVPPSTFRMALRSESSLAVIQIPECTVFPESFSLPIALSPGQPGFTAASPAQGSTILGSLGNRTIYWQFEFTRFAFTNAGALFQSEARIRLLGLSASGIPRVLNGTVSARRIDP